MNRTTIGLSLHANLSNGPQIFLPTQGSLLPRTMLYRTPRVARTSHATVSRSVTYPRPLSGARSALRRTEFTYSNSADSFCPGAGSP